jgi:DNA polymerase III subunit gamma/tau
MDNYIVSARKYRPDTFESVVGQENITRTLKNAIRQKQLAQAYLFCGPRGVGKTTNARIFAKTINCYNLDENTNPCNECESCKAFNQQRSMNIHELDAASNNSVEDIRNLIDQVRIPPQIGQYSVYIIDEVHMLSSAAFNAFLKTLEEPPKHAVFILATTEKHKILPTILSRCQVYDFNRITVADIVNRLKYVAQSEQIIAEEESLQIIAQKADGAMRDALSIFDQIVSFAGNNITYQHAIDNLNVLDYDYYFKLTDALSSGKHLDSLLIYNEILNKGFQGNYFITGLASHLRDLLICKDINSAELLEVGASIREKYLEKSANTSESFLIKSLEIATECDYKYKTSNNKRLHVEMALIRMASVSKQKENEYSQTQSNQSNEQRTKPSPVAQKPQGTKSVATETQATYSKDSTKTSEEKTDKPKPQTPKIPTSKPMSFSLKNDVGKQEINNTEKQENNVINQITGNDPFTEEVLIKAWKNIAEANKNQPRVHQNLLTYLPKKVSETQIEVTMPSASLTRVLKDISNEILSALQTALNNNQVNLTIKTVENQNDLPKKAYTAEEKYQEMIKSNPEIQNLRQQLDANLF